MEPASIPPNEFERLQALYKFNLLDSLPEEAFDSITAQAARQFDVPIALISLVDANRQWFKSCVGLRINQTGRDESFCAHALLEPSGLFIIPDTVADPRFADNPLVTGEPFIRFYAGATLVTPQGYALGTLCLIDQQPRELSAEQQTELLCLADRVMGRIKLRLSTITLDKINNNHFAASHNKL